jgi:hypothetical protein
LIWSARGGWEVARRVALARRVADRSKSDPRQPGWQLRARPFARRSAPRQSWSKSGQRVVKEWSNNGQRVVKEWSKGGRIAPFAARTRREEGREAERGAASGECPVLATTLRLQSRSGTNLRFKSRDWGRLGRRAGLCPEPRPLRVRHRVSLAPRK